MWNRSYIVEGHILILSLPVIDEADELIPISLCIFQEFMLKQLVCSRPVLWVLCQALLHEVFEVGGKSTVYRWRVLRQNIVKNLRLPFVDVWRLSIGYLYGENSE